MARVCRDCRPVGDSAIGPHVELCAKHAAAEDMLKALEELLSVPNKKRPDRVWEEARAAVQKARE